MKTKSILLLATISLMGGFVLACQKTGQPQKTQNEAKIAYWTCTMHPQVHKDGPGQCPICGMTLVPVMEESHIESHQPDALGGQNKAPSVFIASERQQQIGLTKAKIEKKQAVVDIRTSGRVAFDPALAIASQEYIEIRKSLPDLASAARKRLLLMGVSQEEIQNLEKGKGDTSSLILPGKNGKLWVYATLYENEMSAVKTGSSADIEVPGTNETVHGLVRAVDPVIDPETRSVRARIEVEHAADKLKPDMFVKVILKVDLGETLLIPESAVVDSGTRKVAFVMHEKNRFETREIKTGLKAGDSFVALEGLKEGEEVVTSATFLVDSESQLKAAISGK